MSKEICFLNVLRKTNAKRKSLRRNRKQKKRNLKQNRKKRTKMRRKIQTKKIPKIPIRKNLS